MGGRAAPGLGVDAGELLQNLKPGFNVGIVEGANGGTVPDDAIRVDHTGVASRSPCASPVAASPHMILCRGEHTVSLNMAEHLATVEWQRGDQVFVDRRFSRAHVWRFDGGAEIPASPSPHVVPVPLSVESHVDPEEAFVAALASCHMLFFLDLCSRHKYTVDSYRDQAVGRLGKNEAGKLAMLEVTLNPEVVFSGEQQPDQARLERLHHRAHEQCFIANSVTTVVKTAIP